MGIKRYETRSQIIVTSMMCLWNRTDRSVSQIISFSFSVGNVIQVQKLADPSYNLCALSIMEIVFSVFLVLTVMI